MGAWGGGGVGERSLVIDGGIAVWDFGNYPLTPSKRFSCGILFFGTLIESTPLPQRSHPVENLHGGKHCGYI
jgi:hypothetical protein